MLRRAIKRTQVWAKTHGALTGLLGVTSGALLGAGTPLWQHYWVETPELNLEIYAIERLVASDARLPSEDDALKILTPSPRMLFESRLMGGEAIGSFGNRSGYTAEQADLMLAEAKAEQKDLPDRIEERERQLREVGSLSPERITLNDVLRLNAPINPEFEYTAAFASPTPEGLAERQRAVVHFQTQYRQRLDALRERYTALQTQLPSAERRLEELKNELDEKKGFFQVTAILNNSGRKSVSIRQLALLRVYIGKGNYVDIRLNLVDYQSSAEVPAGGTRIAVFESDLLEQFTQGDRSLAENYWGQSVHGVLFVEDIEGHINASNRISFASGLYIREVYDRLTAEASKIRYQRGEE
jgi:hypothetical protein